MSGLLEVIGAVRSSMFCRMNSRLSNSFESSILNGLGLQSKSPLPLMSMLARLLPFRLPAPLPLSIDRREDLLNIDLSKSKHRSSNMSTLSSLSFVAKYVNKRTKQREDAEWKTQELNAFVELLHSDGELVAVFGELTAKCRHQVVGQLFSEGDLVGGQNVKKNTKLKLGCLTKIVRFLNQFSLLCSASRFDLADVNTERKDRLEVIRNSFDRFDKQNPCIFSVSSSR